MTSGDAARDKRHARTTLFLNVIQVKSGNITCNTSCHVTSDCLSVVYCEQVRVTIIALRVPQRYVPHQAIYFMFNLHININSRLFPMGGRNYRSPPATTLTYSSRLVHIHTSDHTLTTELIYLQDEMTRVMLKTSPSSSFSFISEGRARSDKT